MEKTLRPLMPMKVKISRHLLLNYEKNVVTFFAVGVGNSRNIFYQSCSR